MVLTSAARLSRFAGKVVAVTGSSAGIGQQTALDFAREGASVTVHGLFAGEKNAVHDAEKFLVDAGIPADRFLVVPGPIEAAKTQESIVESTLKKFGRLDVLVNNAAVMKPPGMSVAEMDTSMECFDYVFAVNLRRQASYAVT